jgi:hypothetical protein
MKSQTIVHWWERGDTKTNVEDAFVYEGFWLGPTRQDSRSLAFWDALLRFFGCITERTGPSHTQCGPARAGVHCCQRFRGLYKDLGRTFSDNPDLVSSVAFEVVRIQAKRDPL